MSGCVSWLIFDVVFYSNSLFSSQVVGRFISAPSAASASPASVHSFLLRVALSTLCLSLCALPGYLGATLVIDRWGRRRLQLFGFAGMTLSYALCAASLPWLLSREPLFYALYGLSFFFCNMGPNVTTFVIPAELFPTGIRATAHGLSAAAGKVGAAIGTAVMPLLLTASSLSVVLYLSAGISVLGLLWTLALTAESRDRNVCTTTEILQGGNALLAAARDGNEDGGRQLTATEAEAEAQRLSKQHGQTAVINGDG